MYTPQVATCERCGYQAHVITEDIRVNHLRMSKCTHNDLMYIRAKLACPCCKRESELFFEEKHNNRNGTLFECVYPNNEGLLMWRSMNSGKPLPPYFRVVSNNRTSFEQQLDAEGRKVAENYYRWKDDPKPGQTAEQILGELEDYTKGMTWKKFKKDRFVVAICSQDGNPNHFKGFNSDFSKVNTKNQLLLDGITLFLAGEIENYSYQFCDNKIGRCAEVHAANSCLNKETVQMLDELRFSVAYLCRLAIPRPYCLNCITLFPTVRNG